MNVSSSGEPVSSVAIHSDTGNDLIKNKIVTTIAQPVISTPCLSFNKPIQVRLWSKVSAFFPKIVKISDFVHGLLNPRVNIEYIEERLKKFGKQLRACQSFQEVEYLGESLSHYKKILVEAKPFSKIQEVTNPLNLLLLKACDQFSRQLLTRILLDKKEHPLSEANNWEKRLVLAAQVRTLAAATPIRFHEMEEFSADQITPLTLAGKKMDPGIHYHPVDSNHLLNNRATLSQRIVYSHNNEKKVRWEFRCQLSHLTREQLSSSIQAFRDEAFIRILSKECGCQIKITNGEKVYYESALSNPDEPKAEFKEGKADFANMIKIDFEGIGEVFIGDEAITPSFRSLSHHSLLVRLYEQAPDSMEGKIGQERMEKMHRALALLGLSEILHKGSMEQVRRNQVLQIVDIYLPHLSYPLGHSIDFQGLSSTQLQKEIVDLLPDKHETEITKNAMREIFKSELSHPPQLETSPLGSQFIKLYRVAELVHQEGAVGCFAGVHDNPGVVASVIKTGLISSHERNYAGFPYASTCQEDSITGGNESVFVRLATGKMLEKMADGSMKLAECPYIQTYQIIVSLEIFNLPHNRMHTNSFGLINPLAEIVTKENKSISGASVLRSESPQIFVRSQNEDPTLDNEIMIRTGALSPLYIQKILYQDPREELLAYLKKHDAPLELLGKIENVINHGGVIDRLEIEDFLEKNHLKVESRDWRGHSILKLKDWKSEFNFPDRLDALLHDPKAELINELRKNNLISEDNKIYGRQIENFIVKTKILKEEYFL